MPDVLIPEHSIDVDVLNHEQEGPRTTMSFEFKMQTKDSVNVFNIEVCQELCKLYEADGILSCSGPLRHSNDPYIGIGNITFDTDHGTAVNDLLGPAICGIQGAYQNAIDSL